MLRYILIVVFSLMTSSVLLRSLIPRLKSAGMIGHDVNKPERPDVAEMGGIGIVAGFTAGILLSLFLQTFFGMQFNMVFVLVSLITIFSLAFIGIVDDMIDIPQAIKALLPLFAAIPLVVVKAAGATTIAIPFLGVLDFGMIYIFLLIPIAVAGASNLTNMLAGFNGMESGMGIVMFACLSLLAFFAGKTEMLVLSLSMLGALIGFFYYNKYPSKVFPGDAGTLVIGATLACAIIIGNFESAGVLLAIPYMIDFFIKAKNRFPSRGWQGIYKEGKLYAPEKPISFAQYVMKAFNGISEKNLTLFFIGLEAICGVIAIALFIFKL